MFGCLGALGTTFIVIPSVAWMSKNLGKKKAFMLSQSISLVGYIMLYFLFIPGKPWMYIFALPFFSFGIGSLFTIMMSMTADVIDVDQMNTGKRREGIFGAIYWWMVKVGFGIAGALSGVIITVVGFNPDLAAKANDFWSCARKSLRSHTIAVGFLSDFESTFIIIYFFQLYIFCYNTLLDSNHASIFFSMKMAENM